MQALAIEVNRLTKDFGAKKAVRDLSFAVPPGTVTGFVGGNGSGKTTTMRMILGLTTPTHGFAHIRGKPLAAYDQPRQVVGAVSDRLGAHPGLSGRRHLSLLATASGVDRDRVDHVLDVVSLHDAADQRISSYSTGMSQRLALAAALLADAPVLILDEPSSGLDPAGIRWLRDLLRAHADAGGTVFVSTHQLAELGSIVDHLVIVHDGTLVAAGSATALLDASSAHSIEDLVLEGGNQ